MKRLLAKINEKDKVRNLPKEQRLSYKFPLAHRTVFLNVWHDYLDDVMSFSFQVEDEEGNVIDRVMIDIPQDNDICTIEQGKDIDLI